MRLSDLKPRWEHCYDTWTKEEGGKPLGGNGDTMLTFLCPVCGPKKHWIQIRLTTGALDQVKRVWSMSKKPDGMNWPESLSISPSINNIGIPQGPNRVPCMFHSTLINGEFVP